MRPALRLLLALILALAFVPRLSAQDPPRKVPLVEIKQTRVGFLPNEPADSQGRFKIGMWTPVYLKIKAGPKGIHPKGPGEPPPYIQVENEDSDNVGTIYRTPFTMEANEERWVMSYGKPGTHDFKIQVVIGDLTPFRPPFVASSNALDLNTHLYVSLGDRIPDLQRALVEMRPKQGGGQPGAPESWPRFAGHEPDVDQLPESWFGYQSVDLLFLSTRDKDFLLQLGKDNDASRARLRAISQWVRRGGRLVIGVSPRTTDVLSQVLHSTVWQPPVPVVPPKEGVLDALQLVDINRFAQPLAGTDPFRGRVALLDPGKVLPGAWEVFAKTDEPNPDDAKPLIARMPYGLGSITFLAFGLDEPPFTTWDANGRKHFLKSLVEKLGPRVSTQVDANEQRGNFDLSTDLHKALDNFDVRVIPFGYVALFIVIYIIIVGPLDFLVLKYVVKRLEWTWFTFPTVVIAVSVAAYYTAYAIKGNELKINRVDLVDFDLRTSLDAKGQTKKASVFGQTFFTILSPQIKNYTIGVEPNAAFWGQQNPEKAGGADMVSWFGRADNIWGGMQRGGGQGFFRKPYVYAPEAAGLYDVPIPVWTTKSFQASWEVVNVTPPFQANLIYHQEQDVTLTGTLKSGLAVDLENAWLFYRDKAFPIAGGVPQGAEIKISLEDAQKRSLKEEWVSSGKDGPRIQTAQGPYNPSDLLRQIQFNDKLNVNTTTRNHALRGLDLSWRLLPEPGGTRDRRVREAILVGRVKFAAGDAAALSTDANNPLPATLWLGDLPGEKKMPRPPDGTLAQDSFVRVILPVRPKE